MGTLVSIIKINEYNDLFAAIKHGIELIGGIDVQGKKVLLKPNCLSATKNAVTDTKVVANVVKLVKEYGGTPQIGDSPMGIPSAKKIYTSINEIDIIEKEEPEWVSFNDESVIINSKDYDFEILKQTAVAKNFIKADYVINLPKLKTHPLTNLTGSIKNYWGIQSGTSKSKTHLYAGRNSLKFNQVLADLYSFVVYIQKNNLTIMDAINAMQGSGGPSFGSMVNLGLIISGTDPVAVDTVATAVAGHETQEVPVLGILHDRGLGIGDLDQIEVVGKPISEVKKRLIFPNALYSWAFNQIQIFNRALRKFPRLKKNLCKQCLSCVKLCPMESIKVEFNNFPQFNKNNCINCGCCAEGCPENAIRMSYAGISGLLGIY